MNVNERQFLKDTLNAGHNSFLAAVAGVSEVTAKWSPGEGRWSILECAEHVAVAQDHMVGQVEIAKPGDTADIDPRRESIIPKRLADRSKKVESPEVARPAGRFPSLNAALEHFHASHFRALSFVEYSAEDLRKTLAQHPLIGPVTCYELLLIIAAHPQRHAKQVTEILNLRCS